MAFKIVRNSITRVKADAIVNTANTLPVVGRGTDAAIYKKAGYDALLAERKKIGEIKPGESAVTSSCNLKIRGVKYIIHTVGDVYNPEKPWESEFLLRGCYASALYTAVKLGCKSVAIPLLGTGSFGYPKDVGFQIAVDEINRFILKCDDIQVILVVYDDISFKLSEKLFNDVRDYLYENYTGDDLDDSDDPGDFGLPVEPERFSIRSACCYLQDDFPLKSSKKPVFEKESASPDVPEELEDFIYSEKTESFRDVLQNLIAKKQMDNAEVWKKANLDRKYFSKIINPKQDISKVPVKHTVMALGLALELPIFEFQAFMASAGYSFMSSDKYDLIIKFCVLHQIYNIIAVNMILNDHGLKTLDEK